MADQPLFAAVAEPFPRDDVRFGSKADMTALHRRVRFTPESGRQCLSRMSAKCQEWTSATAGNVVLRNEFPGFPGGAPAEQAACYGRAMFSTRLDRRRKFNRLAVLVAATLLAVGIALIAVWAVRAFDMLGAAEANRGPIIIGVLIALAVLVVLCLIAYAAVRAVGRFTSRR